MRRGGFQCDAKDKRGVDSSLDVDSDSFASGEDRGRYRASGEEYRDDLMVDICTITGFAACVQGKAEDIDSAPPQVVVDAVGCFVEESYLALDGVDSTFSDVEDMCTEERREQVQ